MFRQIVGFTQLASEVVCWSHENKDVFPLDNIPVRVLSFDPSPQNASRRWLGRLRNLRRGNYHGAAGAEFNALVGATRKSKPSVILCHFGHIALRVLPVALKCRLPLVAHFHGWDVSSSLRNRWYRWSLLRCLRKFSAIIVVGSHQRRWVLEQGVPEHRVHLIPCGVPTDFFSPASNTVSRKRLRIIAVSRLVAWKGLQESIRAFAAACDCGVDAELHIVGDGPQRAELNSVVADLKLERRVSFHGVRGPSEVRQLLSESDIFLQHSVTDPSGWCEGFGVSLAEAASMGLPVVATRSGGIPDQVVDSETGILVTERDVPAMARAICRLVNDPDLRVRMGRAGRKRMIEHFNTAQQIEKLEHVLLDAAASFDGRSSVDESSPGSFL